MQIDCIIQRNALLLIPNEKNLLIAFHNMFFLQYRYKQAKLSVEDRAVKVLKVEESLIYDMELLCLTGVEDKLQQDVKPTLELLRNAGIKVW